MTGTYNKIDLRSDLSKADLSRMSREEIEQYKAQKEKQLKKSSIGMSQCILLVLPQPDYDNVGHGAKNAGLTRQQYV